MQISLKNYKKVLISIRQEISKTEQNITQTVNRQKVEMCWQIGKIIDAHLLENDRADYGKKFFKQLQEDTKINERALYQMRSFYKAYPELPKNENGLNWSHYRGLAAIKNEEQRKQLEDLTITQKLDSDELQSEIKKLHKKPSKRFLAKQTEKLKVSRGKIFTYTLGEKGADLGFNIYLSQKILSAANKLAQNKFTQASEANYSYLARLERVVDGDTIHVELDLGFGIKHHEILRLAKINAAEADTKEGKIATAALEEILKNSSFLIVKTSKTDIYGRYIADVFFDETNKKSDSKEVAESGIYLNQLLLDKGLVERY